MTFNHPRFRSLDAFALTAAPRMRKRNLFPEITGTSYETANLTCKSFKWFISATQACLLADSKPARASLHQVRGSEWKFTQICEWQAVSERNVIICLRSVSCDRAVITSLLENWPSVERNIPAWCPSRGKTPAHHNQKCCPNHRLDVAQWVKKYSDRFFFFFGQSQIVTLKPSQGLKSSSFECSLIFLFFFFCLL